MLLPHNEGSLFFLLKTYLILNLMFFATYFLRLIFRYLERVRERRGYELNIAKMIKTVRVIINKAKINMPTDIKKLDMLVKMFSVIFMIFLGIETGKVMSVLIGDFFI